MTRKFRYFQKFATEPKQIANRVQIAKNITPNALRHIFTTYALPKGISLAVVKKTLGHDRLAATGSCLNFTENHVVEELQDRR